MKPESRGIHRAAQRRGLVRATVRFISNDENSSMAAFGPLAPRRAAPMSAAPLTREALAAWLHLALSLDQIWPSFMLVNRFVKKFLK
ncbi:hypothetical protein [Burkholderia glumae]|uniref:hypothetical protein n=1 Tax=Burkholderia glumae TaxID=337 RepID=UPI002151AEC4|nr:hypothetical protein [Burkholderia glumae]